MLTYLNERDSGHPLCHAHEKEGQVPDGHAVTLTGLDGKAVKIAPGSDFNVDEAFGLMVLDLVKSMRKEKAFAPLFLAPGAELIIEADDSAFGWPQYEDRGKDNRI